MGNAPVVVLVKKGEGRIEAGCDVVGREDGYFGSFAEAFAAHHQDVHVRDGQDGGGTVGGCGNVLRQEGSEVGAHADGTHARTTTAVGNAESLVQIEVRDVGTVLAGLCETDLGVEICAIKINLTTVLVDGGADFADLVFEHAMGGGVSDHQRGQFVAVLRGFGFQVCQVYVTFGVAGYDDHVHADHVRGCRIGAVSGGRDEADVAVAFVAAEVVRTDCQEACVLTLRSGVGLQQDRVIAGDLAQFLLQILEHSVVPGGLLLRRKGMHVAELGPGDGQHF